MISFFFGRSNALEGYSHDSASSGYITAQSSPGAFNLPDDVPAHQGRIAMSNRHNLRLLDESKPSPISTLLLVKQAELGRIIKDIQSAVQPDKQAKFGGNDYWAEASYTKLNARLCNWHESLPSELRWSRWSSNLDELEPSLASLL